MKSTKLKRQYESLRRGGNTRKQWKHVGKIIITSRSLPTYIHNGHTYIKYKLRFISYVFSDFSVYSLYIP